MHSIRVSMLVLVFCLSAGSLRAQPPAIIQPSERDSDAEANARSQPADAAKTRASAATESEPKTSTDRVSSGAWRANNTTQGSGQQPPTVGQTRVIEELRPEVLYLRDKNGRLVPVPGFSYEDFLELLRLQQSQPSAKMPGYSLQQALISGEINGKLARLTVQFDVNVRTADWVQVPLGLGAVALVGPPEYDGRGDYVLDYDNTKRQFVVWLRGLAGADHRLTLELHAPVAITGTQRKLALSLPRAATSRLTLRVAASDVVASATPAELVPEVTSRDGTSNITVLGIGGDFTVSWSEGDASAARAGPVLESTGLVLARIDGRSVTSDATLNVRSFGASFDRFRVRLPKGAALAGGQQPGYTVAAIDAARSLVEVKLDNATIGPVEIKLQTERAFDLTQPETLELAGFEVLEAVPHRQGGQIGVVVTGDWQVVWASRSRLRQIDEPVEALQRRDLLAAFEYVGQPCSLTARVVPRQPRIAVDPQYVYYVDAFQTTLEARLKYTIRGAKVFSLELDLPGWQVDEISPATIVDDKSIVTGEDARLRIPLLQPMVGDVEITVRAHRSHSTNPGDIELQVPVLKDAVVEPATVAILPDDNVELTTRTDKLVGLRRQRAPATLNLPVRRQEPLIFRGERANAKYVAGIAVHPQKISVQIANTAAVGRNGVEVEQQFQYQVFYEPIERLSFAVPATLASSGGVEIYVNDEQLEPELAADDQQGVERLRMHLDLPAPSIGLVKVVCRFRRPLPELRPASTVPLEIPLLMPLQGEFVGNTLDVDCETGLAAELRSGSWRLIEPAAPTAGRNLRLTSATAASSAPLSVLVEERPVGGVSVLEGGWIQTWVADRSRQERAVFRISGAAPTISLALPPGADVSAVEALLDSRPIHPTLNAGNTVTVNLPSPGAYTLELRYPYVSRGGGISLALDVPDFGEAVRLRRLYWQVIVPRNQHLLASSSNLTPEFRWVWDRLHWSRSNLLAQSDLEDWTKAIREPTAPEAMNVYLFSVIGAGESSAVWIARRSTIVFVASSTVLAIALLALYVSPLRRPRSLVAIGAALGVLALAYPEPAVVLAQAALLGVALALAATLLRRALPGEPRREELPKLPTSSIAERSSTDVFQKPAQAAAPSSTASVVVAIEHPSSASQVR